MVQAILCLFLCLPTGIVAIVMASKANQLKAAGDIGGALTAANNAKTWCWISVALGVLSIVVWIALASQSGNDPAF